MRSLYLLIFAVFFITCSCKKDDDGGSSQQGFVTYKPVAVSKTNSMQLYVHYMPWFENKTTSGTGKWGWHWTMNNQNPDIMDATGKRQIASHFYPKIGPYASSDPDLIEYHLLLMKYSGIDGILIDWYGSSDVNDYGSNKRNTEALVNMIDKVGLKFAIVYEDATIKQVLSSNPSSDAVSLARNDMNYLQQNFFSKSSYIKINNSPLLLDFGPSYFHQASDWVNIVSACSPKPCFMPLWGTSSQTGAASTGEFIWVDQVNIDTKYATKGNFTSFIGGAWPGFHDFYKEGNAGNNLFVIDYNNGAVWNDLLNKAKANNINYLQLITWNDFGEGTMIEPTEEFGYSYLTRLQSFAGTTYQQSDLESIAKQYALRKSKAADASAKQALDQAFYYWVSLQKDKASHIVDSLAVLKK